MIISTEMIVNPWKSGWEETSGQRKKKLRNEVKLRRGEEEEEETTGEHSNPIWATFRAMHEKHLSAGQRGRRLAQGHMACPNPQSPPSSESIIWSPGLHLRGS